jgi:hypothetical protein
MLEEERSFMNKLEELKANMHEGPRARMEPTTHFITMADIAAAFGTINRQMGIV